MANLKENTYPSGIAQIVHFSVCFSTLFFFTLFFCLEFTSFVYGNVGEICEKLKEFSVV